MKIIKYVALFLILRCCFSCTSEYPTINSKEESEYKLTENLHLNFVELINESIGDSNYLAAEYTFYSCDTNYQLPFKNLDSLKINNLNPLIFADILTISDPELIKVMGSNRIKMFRAYIILDDTCTEEEFIKMTKHQISVDSVYISDKTKNLMISCEKKTKVGKLPFYH